MLHLKDMPQASKTLKGTYCPILIFCNSGSVSGPVNLKTHTAEKKVLIASFSFRKQRICPSEKWREPGLRLVQPAVTEKALIELSLSLLLITLTSHVEECYGIVINIDKATSSFRLLLCLLTLLPPSPWVELSAYRVGAERGAGLGRSWG